MKNKKDGKKNELTIKKALFMLLGIMVFSLLIGVLIFGLDLEMLLFVALGSASNSIAMGALFFLLQYLERKNAKIKNGPLFRNWRNIDGHLISDLEFDKLKDYLSMLFPQVLTIANLSVGRSGLYSTRSIRIVLQQNGLCVSCEFERTSDEKTLKLKQLNHEEETTIYEKLALALQMCGLVGN